MSKLGIMGLASLIFGIWLLVSYLNHDQWFQYLLGLIPASFVAVFGLAFRKGVREG